jgi:hypothetical protein
MKRFLLFGAVTACVTAILASAGPALTETHFSFSNITTNTSANVTGSIVTNSVRITGPVKSVILKFTGAGSPSVHVAMTTTTSGALGVARTILDKASITASGEYAVTIPKTTTGGTANTNDGTEMCLLNDVVTCSAYAANKTNVNVTVYLVTQ